MTGTLAIVQARSSSTRFPRKVLEDLHGAPMIVRQLERIARAETLDRVIVATSVEGSDDELADVLTAHGAEVRRGSLDDVLGRFAAIVDELEPQLVVRLTADCPLTDPAVIDATVRLHLASGADYTSDVVRRTFPHGLDVECVDPAAFARLRELPLSPAEHEHVTIGLYTRPELFSIASHTQAIDLSDLRWTVDYPGDLTFVRAVYAELYDANPAFGMAEIVDLIARRPELDRRAAAAG